MALPVLPARQIAACAQPRGACPGPGSGLAQRVLVFPTDPGRDADAGGGQLLLVAAEGQELAADVDIDDPLVRAGADIGVGRERHAEVQAPALARADPVEEPVDVERHPGGRVAGQNLLEMPRRELVLVLEEERAGEFEADADQPGLRDQHGVEGDDRLVEQGVAGVVGKARLLRHLERREAEEEQDVRLDRPALDQRPQHAQRLAEPAVADQGLGASRRRLDGSGGGGGRRRRGGEEEQHGQRRGGQAKGHGASLDTALRAYSG